MNRVFIISDYADPSPKGRSDKVNTRVRVFRENGLETIVIVPYDSDITENRPDGIEAVKYAGYKLAPIPSHKFVSRVFRKLAIPDAYFRWIIPGLRAIERYSPDAGDVIITMASPVSNHLIGFLCKRRHGMKWIADFRDPWVKNQLAHYRWLPIHQRLERLTVENADKVIVLTGYEMEETYFETTYGLSAEKVLKYGYVGYDEAKVQGRWEKGQRRLLFVGTFYPPHVTPVHLLEGFRKYLDNPGADSELHLEFYGTWRPEWDTLVEDLNLHDKVKTYGFCSHDEVVAALADSVGAIVIVPDRPSERNWIPSKVSEYIGLRVPILAICPYDSAIHNLIEKYHLGEAVEPEDIHQGIKLLLSLVDAGEFETASMPAPQEFNRVANERAIVQEIESLL